MVRRLVDNYNGYFSEKDGTEGSLKIDQKLDHFPTKNDNNSGNGLGKKRIKPANKGTRKSGSGSRGDKSNAPKLADKVLTIVNAIPPNYQTMFDKNADIDIEKGVTSDLWRGMVQKALTDIGKMDEALVPVAAMCMNLCNLTQELVEKKKNKEKKLKKVSDALNICLYSKILRLTCFAENQEVGESRIEKSSA